MKPSKKILILSDNEELLNRFIEQYKNSKSHQIDYRYSEVNKSMSLKHEKSKWLESLNVKKNVDLLIKEYNIIFSLHSKQIFPSKLVENVKCINVHPGFNPNNRGWFPQVFSIINGLPCGVTIHEMDEQLDHGPIIYQSKIKIESWDTSLTVYNKIIDKEINLLGEHFEDIVNGNYELTKPCDEGNLNLKKDFNKLCEIDLMDIDSFSNHINKLRALTHGDYYNAYFIDNEGYKVFLKVDLEKM